MGKYILEYTINNILYLDNNILYLEYTINNMLYLEYTFK